MDAKTWTREFTERLKESLKSANMTQKELAEKCGSTEASISRYITGERVPRATAVCRISEALNVSPNYLLGMENDDLKAKADGCVGCAFKWTEEWEMPCCKCKRAMKDYWRAERKG